MPKGHAKAFTAGAKALCRTTYLTGAGDKPTAMPRLEGQARPRTGATMPSDTGPATSTATPARAALTIDVEEWFHSYNVKGVISRKDWDACASRVEHTTMQMLKILANSNVRATFFVLGWVAEKHPSLVKKIASAGHEIASHGYNHEPVYSLSPQEFRSDILRSKHYLEDLIGSTVQGYRAPCFSITDWALPILEKAGFAYDSSAVPTVRHDRYGSLTNMDAAQPITYVCDELVEVCISCLRLGKRGLPWGGGGYFRLLPYWLWMRGVHSILDQGLPYVFYTHPWEIDADQPHVPGMTAANRFRQRVNLGSCHDKFRLLVGAFDWKLLGDLCKAWKEQLASETMGARVIQ